MYGIPIPNNMTNESTVKNKFQVFIKNFTSNPFFGNNFGKTNKMKKYTKTPMIGVACLYLNFS
jgi:hypothetical protein